jgi:hypothetical protein
MVRICEERGWFGDGQRVDRGWTEGGHSMVLSGEEDVLYTFMEDNVFLCFSGLEKNVCFFLKKERIE